VFITTGLQPPVRRQNTITVQVGSMLRLIAMTAVLGSKPRKTDIQGVRGNDQTITVFCPFPSTGPG